MCPGNQHGKGQQDIRRQVGYYFMVLVCVMGTTNDYKLLSLPSRSLEWQSMIFFSYQSCLCSISLFFKSEKANYALFVFTKGLMLKFLKPIVCQILVNIAGHADCVGVASWEWRTSLQSWISKYMFSAIPSKLWLSWKMCLWIFQWRLIHWDFIR